MPEFLLGLPGTALVAVSDWFNSACPQGNRQHCVANSIAFAAFALSSLALWLNFQANKKIVGIEKDRDDREDAISKSALLTAHLEKGPTGTTFFCVENSGAARAKNILVAYNSSGNPQRMALPDFKRIGLENGSWELGSGGKVSVPIDRDFRSEPPRQVKITWTDGKGSDNEWVSALGQPR